MRNKKLEEAFLKLMENGNSESGSLRREKAYSSIFALKKAIDLLDMLCLPDDEKSALMGLPIDCYNEDAILRLVRGMVADGVAFAEKLNDVLSMNGYLPNFSSYELSVSEEYLAKFIHESFRSPVKHGYTLAQSKGLGYRFVEWADLTPEAREGKRQVARALLSRFRIVFKDGRDAVNIPGAVNTLNATAGTFSDGSDARE